MTWEGLNATPVTAESVVAWYREYRNCTCTPTVSRLDASDVESVVYWDVFHEADCPAHGESGSREGQQ